MDDISLGVYPGLRLRPLDLTTNHGLLQCPSLYCGASLDSFSQLLRCPSLYCGASLDSFSQLLRCPSLYCGASLDSFSQLLRCPSLYCGASLDSFSQAVATSLPTPPPTTSRPPTHPLSTLAQNWCTPSKKRSEIA